MFFANLLKLISFYTLTNNVNAINAKTVEINFNKAVKALPVQEAMLDKMIGNFQKLIHTGNHRNLKEFSIWLLFSFIGIIHNRILGLCPPGEHGHDDVG